MRLFAAFFCWLLLVGSRAIAAVEGSRWKESVESEEIEKLYGETLYSWNNEGESVEASTKELLQG